MIVTAIAAIDKMGLIGRNGTLPWRLPRDLRRFRQYTLHKPVIMGRRTYQSLNGPLRERPNIILTHNPSFCPDRCQVAHSLDDAWAFARQYLGTAANAEAMIIGGADVFTETVPLWDRLLLTVVEGEFQGDSYFPLDRVAAFRWTKVQQEYFPADDTASYPHWFLTLERQRVDRDAYHDFDLGLWLRLQATGACNT